MKKCTTCKGSGEWKDINEPCPDCMGSGIEIPAMFVFDPEFVEEFESLTIANN
jgi:RecJ-like exonuclease